VQRFCGAIDALNEWAGRIVAWLFLPLVLIATAEVVARYVFDRPTPWAWDVNVQIMAVLVVLGGGWGLLKGWHVRVDVLWGRLSPRKKVMVDLIIFPFFLFAVGILLWQSASAALLSVQVGELYSSYFAPPIYPLKIIVVLGFSLLLLQGIVKFIRDLLLLTKGEGRP